MFILYLAGAAALGLALSRLLELLVNQGRRLMLSLATRNSFVVLRFALALPPSWETVVIVIVFQSPVELVGIVAFIWLVPYRLLPVASNS